MSFLRHSRPSKRVVVATAVGLAVALAAAFWSAERGEGGKTTLTRAHLRFAALSTTGRVVRLSPRTRALAARRQIVRLKPRQAWLLARRGDVAFYRVVSADGSVCYGTGFAGSPGDLALIECVADPPFPSTARPLLDFTTMEGGAGGALHPTRVMGLAADGVASVALADLSGRVLADTPVTNNVYWFGTASTAVSAAELRALDPSGAVVGTVRF